MTVCSMCGKESESTRIRAFTMDTDGVEVEALACWPCWKVHWKYGFTTSDNREILLQSHYKEARKTWLGRRKC